MSDVLRWGREMAPAPPTHALGRFAWVSLVSLMGYMVAGRAFAQVGVPALNLYVGEALLVGMVLYGPTRAVLLAALRTLVRPSQTHGFIWLILSFVGYGALQLVRGVAAGFTPVEAAKVFAFDYLIVYLFAGIALGALVPDALQWLTRVLPWVNVVYLGIFFLALRSVRLRLPFSAVPVLTPGMATVVCIALIACYGDDLRYRWYLLGSNLFFLLFLQIRGDWLAIGAAFVVWAVVRRRIRPLLTASLVAVLLLLTVSMSGLSIPGAPSRGGAVDVTEIAARAIAPFDVELATRLSPEAAQFAGTTEWRRQWWGYIWRGVHETPTRELFGYGYGFPLSDLFPQLAEELVRTPHSVFYFTLGYSGWIGVTIFALVQLTLWAKLTRAGRARVDPFGRMMWVIALASGMFGNFYETPFNAIPFYVLCGLYLTPLVPELVGAARGAAGATTEADDSDEGYQRRWV